MILFSIGAYVGGAVAWYHQAEFFLHGSRRVLASGLWPFVMAVELIEAARGRRS
jgi:hypothetical protein